MSDRDLSTSKRDVFGSVQRGTVCRVCGRDVESGRESYCTDRCRDIADAVMRLLNWGSYKELIKGRDDYVCQRCGVDPERYRRAREQIREMVNELTIELKPARGEYNLRYGQARSELKDRYNLAEIRQSIPHLQVDHIERVADGGALFDESNLQTLCDDCHKEKTAEENSKWDRPEMDFEVRTIQDFIDHGEVEQ